jgi:hypothetical protein
MRKTRQQFKQKRIDKDTEQRETYAKRMKDLSIKFWKTEQQVRKIAQNYTLSELFWATYNPENNCWIIKEINF